MSESGQNEYDKIFFQYLKEEKVKDANKFRSEHPRYNPNLEKAPLVGKNFQCLNLSAAKSKDTDEIDVEKEVNLVDSDLWGVDLTGADLTGANCQGANFNHANFVNANLTQVNFDGASLRGADFSGAKFDNTKLHGANLFDAKNLPLEIIEKHCADLKNSLQT